MLTVYSGGIQPSATTSGHKAKGRIKEKRSSIPDVYTFIGNQVLPQVKTVRNRPLHFGTLFSAILGKFSSSSSVPNVQSSLQLNPQEIIEETRQALGKAKKHASVMQAASGLIDPKRVRTNLHLKKYIFTGTLLKGWSQSEVLGELISNLQYLQSCPPDNLEKPLAVFLQRFEDAEQAGDFMNDITPPHDKPGENSPIDPYIKDKGVAYMAFHPVDSNSIIHCLAVGPTYSREGAYHQIKRLVSGEFKRLQREQKQTLKVKQKDYGSTWN